MLAGQKVVTKANLSHSRAKTLKSMTCDESMNDISVVVGPRYQRNKVSGHVIRKKSISGLCAAYFPITAYVR